MNSCDLIIEPNFRNRRTESTDSESSLIPKVKKLSFVDMPMDIKKMIQVITCIDDEGFEFPDFELNTVESFCEVENENCKQFTRVLA
mmetsp:Transcript_30209/g.97179  ORF Transcript_30209/g.97179 Transcript_30209/m.97179 type:complete len:87 (+) Transcript_30209:3-263(+)